LRLKKYGPQNETIQNYGATMITNYFILAFRHLKKQFLYFLINLLGLGIALGACFLLLLYTINEFNYDRYHPSVDQTYLLLTRELSKKEYDGKTPYPFAEVIRNQIPEVQYVSQLFYQPIQFQTSNLEQSDEQDFMFTDREMFKLFDIRITRGLSVQKWNDPYQIYISETLCKRYFPDLDPIGETIDLDENNQKTTLKIAGLFQPMPSNTHLRMDVIAPISLARKIYENQEFMGFRWSAFDSWDRSPLHTYIQIKKESSLLNIREKLKQIAQAHIENPENVEYDLQAVQDIHLHSTDINNYAGVQGNIQQILLLLGIAILVLFIAVFNFILLSTARGHTRLREIGLRKVMGAQKTDIIRQTLAESVLTALLSLPVALLFAETILPVFNNLIQKNLILLDLRNWTFIICAIGLTLLVGILSGSYSAFHYSRFQPVQLLKTAHTVLIGKSVFRRLLIVVQFVIFIGLIVSTLTIFQQFQYIQHKNLGYNKEHLITIPMESKQVISHYPVFKNKLNASPAIADISGAAYTPPTETFLSAKFDNADKSIEFIFVDYNYFKTMDIQVLEGAAFSEERPSDKEGIVLTASAIPYLELENPVIGQNLFGMGPILGIVNDFHIRSLYRGIRPVMFKVDPNRISTAVVRLRGNMIPQGLNTIKKAWEELNPDIPFTFQFVDEALNLAYQRDLRFGRLIQMFTILAIFIACLGLFGLSLFMAEQKTKEIGTRKVLGASIFEIIRLLTKEYTKWLLIANIAAWPVAYYFMNKWLQNFAYRAPIQWWTFLLAGGFALLIALLTVSWQTIRAATANPVKALRYE
jgi:putative ABC transport system permease protein